MHVSNENFQALKAKTQESPSGCWEWTGGMHGVGYGSCSAKFGGGSYAHRSMFVAVHGAIPEGMYVLHKCDNRKCINPDHLFAGTHHDNIKDMHAKGRQRGGSMPGDKNPSAKLTHDDVTMVRQAREAGVQKKVIEQEFGISETQYYRIVKGRSWPEGIYRG